MTTPNTAVSTTERKPLTLRDELEGDSFKAAVAKALPQHLKPERFIRIAVTAMNRVPALKECDRASFFNALLSLSQFGLEPDGRRAHLIPFKNARRGITECQLIIDYKGLVELAMRSGAVSSIHADKVCDADVFEVDRGTITKHLVDYKSPRGKAYAYYCLIKFKDGGEKAEVMTLDEVSAIRARSRAGTSGPWVTDFDQMALKTVFRRASKWITLSPELADAVDSDHDSIEDRRFEAARPVFQEKAPSLFEAGVASQEPVIELPQETNLSVLKRVIEKAGVTEAALLDYLRQSGVIDEAIGSLDEAWETDSKAIDTVIKTWNTIAKNIAKAQ